MKVYISSTFRDLREHRTAVDRALRRMGHDVIGMEQYVADGGRPLDKCLSDVRLVDAYVIVLAWRYGFVPDADNPGRTSVTEFEYREAVKVGKPILAFLLDPDAPWPPAEMDAMAVGRTGSPPIERFRSEVGGRHLAGIFRTPEDLASQVAAAVAAQGATAGMVGKLLSATAVQAMDMGGFGSGGAVSDSSLAAIKQMVVEVGESRSLVVNLGGGDDWWSTRLYLLASLVRSLTSVRQMVFTRANGTFAGMASPVAVADALATQSAPLRELGRHLDGSGFSQDREREIERHFDAWRDQLLALLPEPPSPTVRPAPRSRPGKAAATGNAKPQARPGEIPPEMVDRERRLKIGVRPELLARWLGDRLFARCIRVDARGPTMYQIQLIIESFLPDVPIEMQGEKTELVQLQVVDRDAFALELARQWVRSGLPRAPGR